MFSALLCATVACILAKPWKIPDYLWALCGAVAMLACRFVSVEAAYRAVAASFEVLAFLAGMMLLSELASDIGLFELLADRAVVTAAGSPTRLFGIVYGCGIVTTALLSNDATAVVVTPSVLAVARRANVDPIPLVLACAFVANAASFLLPIANPANLVLYDGRPPAMLAWLQMFALPSLVAIVTTGVLLWATQSKRLHGCAEVPSDRIRTTPAIRIGMIGLSLTMLALCAASQNGVSLGATTLCCASILALVLSQDDRSRLRRCIVGISWGIFPLVAALFVITAAADHVGLTAILGRLLGAPSNLSRIWQTAALSVSLTLSSALANNLPIGVLTSHLLHARTLFGLSQASAQRIAVVTIDMGPNIAVSASLATMLWLQMLRRAAITYSAWRFLRLGLLIAPLSLLAALTALR